MIIIDVAVQPPQLANVKAPFNRGFDMGNYLPVLKDPRTHISSLLTKRSIAIFL